MQLFVPLLVGRRRVTLKSKSNEVPAVNQELPLEKQAAPAKTPKAEKQPTTEKGSASAKQSVHTSEPKHEEQPPPMKEPMSVTQPETETLLVWHITGQIEKSVVVRPEIMLRQNLLCLKGNIAAGQ